MTAAAERLEFAPPATNGLGRSLVLAVLAHLLLVGALTLGVQWRRTAPTVEVQAELWSAVPQAAAPKQVVAPPPPPPPPPKPAPLVAPPPAPAADAQIALEREKRRLEQQELLAARQREQERLEQHKREQEQAALAKKREQERLAALEKKREQEKLAAEKKREQDRIAAERKRAQEKLAAEKKREQERLQAKKAEEEAQRIEAQRQVNLARMTGLAGASGGAGATGTAARSSGPSSSYGGRVSAIVKPNIVFTENPTDNPTALVEVRAAPDGTIVGRKLVRSSGNKAWDEAVLKAVDKTAVLPRDIDGTVPPVLEIVFRRRD